MSAKARRRVTRKKPGTNVLFEVGKEGRRTGIRAPAVKKDEDDLDNIDEFFASDSDGDDVDVDEDITSYGLSDVVEAVSFGRDEEDDLELPDLPDMDGPSPQALLDEIDEPSVTDYGSPASFSTNTPRASARAKGTPRRKKGAQESTPLTGKRKRRTIEPEEEEEEEDTYDSPLSSASPAPLVLDSPEVRPKKRRKTATATERTVEVLPGDRPKRNRMKPLEYWKNEQVVYGPDKKTGIPTVVGVVHVRESTPKPLRQPGYKKKAHIPVVKLSNEDGVEGEYTLAKTTADVPLYPLEMTENLDSMFCYLTRGAPPKKGAKKNNKIKTGIAYRTEEVVTGVLKIAVRCKTPVQVSHGQMENFFVIHGFLEAIINEQKHLLPSGSFITIPAGIPFQLINRGQSTCRLYFNTLKL